MTLPPELLICLFSISLFFFAYFFLSQKIYTHNKFSYAFIAVSAISVVMFLVSKKEIYNKVIFCAAVLFFYILLLWTIKKMYSILNNFFIKKQWLNKKFINKDFTWVELDDWGDKIWNKEITTTPSPLDYFLTMILLLAPMLLALGLASLTSFLF